MLTNLQIRDYQSLREADLELGRLTVVTGPSSSGKTALIRALRLLAFNARGISYIRRGASSCEVLVTEATDNMWSSIRDPAVVAIQRGARGKDAYYIIPHRDRVAGDTLTFTKLGGKVPEEVSRLLALGEINFAGQFDRPYLLTDSAGEVARKLGELTNVTTIFAAAREANVRRQRLARQLEEARAQEDQLRAEIQRFRGLRARQQAAQQAAAALQRYQDSELKAALLRLALTRLAQAQHHLGTLQELPAEPSTSSLEARTARRARLQQLITGLIQATEAKTRAEVVEAGEAGEEGHYAEQLAELLDTAGVCPTCGQPIGGNRRD